MNRPGVRIHSVFCIFATHGIGLVFIFTRMLRSLSVQNYALIDELHLQFGGHLNIITGETGAGKSILLGALGLLLGQRADSSALLDKARKCIIEGEFESGTQPIIDFFNLNELDADEKIILRREINKEGKSRAFINDTPVNISQLKELGNLLVDIHSQHETLLLNKSGFQLAIVDAFAGNEKQLKVYRKGYAELRAAEAELNELAERKQKMQSEHDYLKFQYDELEAADLKEGEQSALEEELTTLNHAEEIITGLNRLSTQISGGENDLLNQLAILHQSAQSLSKYHVKAGDIAQRLNSLLVEAKDISYEIENLAGEVLPDPQRQEVIQDRLDVLYKLEQKHRVKTAEELISIKEELEAKLRNSETVDEQIGKLQSLIATKRDELTRLAGQLSAGRIKAIPSIESKVKKLLAEVAMPNAVLKIEQQTISGAELGPDGQDNVRFLFSANKGIPYAEISKVASGGELSRLMLCLKSMVAKLMDMPTVIFDEIDTGVSGETAFRIGKLMQDFARSRQLICISHLPQIASRGEDHFFVYKEVQAKKTYTRVRKLSYDERVVEVARMLSGDKPTAVAMENARELLAE